MKKTCQVCNYAKPDKKKYFRRGNICRVCENRLRRESRSEASLDNSKAPDNKSTYEENGNIATGVVLSRNKPKSLDEIARIFKIDQTIWKIQRHVTNSWDVTNKAGEVFTNYQTKVWWERLQEIVDLEAMKSEVVSAAAKHAPKYAPIKKYAVVKKDNLLEINIRDLHLGKLCWRGETGENYDIKIAKQRAMNAVNDLLTKASAFGFEEILIVASDDFFNSDTPDGTTTAGTVQDDDCRWRKMMREGERLFVSMVDTMRQYAPVKIIVAPGNHDTQRSFYLGEFLWAWYHNCKNVDVDNSPPMRKYHSYGKVLLGFTHGDKEKVVNLPMIMATECRKEWADAKFCEFHIAHLHRHKDIKWVSTEESHGVIVRQMRSLSGTDNWHYSKGFVGSIKGAEAFIWNKESGLNASFESNINIEASNM